MGAIGAIAILLIGLIGLLLPIFAIVDLIKKPYSTDKKIVWILTIFFIPFLGSIAYYLIGR